MFSEIYFFNVNLIKLVKFHVLETCPPLLKRNVGKYTV